MAVGMRVCGTRLRLAENSASLHPADTASPAHPSAPHSVRDQTFIAANKPLSIQVFPVVSQVGQPYDGRRNWRRLQLDGIAGPK
jgi:hypothetical protein